MATFMFKVGTLALKTLAKPLADRFKGYVMTHPRGREAALSLAQRLHRAEVTVSRRAEGKEGRAFIGEMTEERGVELASKIASEGFVFAVGAGLVGLEYERTRRKEEAKKRDELAARRRAAAVAEAEREALRLVNEAQERRLADLAGRLRAVEGAVGEVARELRRAATEGAVGGLTPRRPALVDGPSPGTAAAAAAAADDAAADADAAAAAASDVEAPDVATTTSTTSTPVPAADGGAASSFAAGAGAAPSAAAAAAAPAAAAAAGG
jgi:optic atrophy 3 protein